MSDRSQVGQKMSGNKNAGKKLENDSPGPWTKWRERDRAILVQRVLDSHQASEDTNGTPGITAELRAEGILIM